MSGGLGVGAEGVKARDQSAEQNVEQHINQKMRDEPEMAELGIAVSDVLEQEREVPQALAIKGVPDRPEHEDDDHDHGDAEPDQPVSDYAPSTVPRQAGVEEIGRDQKEEPHEEGPVEHEERQKQIAPRRIVDDRVPISAADRHIGLRRVVRDDERGQQHAKPLSIVDPALRSARRSHRAALLRPTGRYPAEGARH